MGCQVGPAFLHIPAVLGPWSYHFGLSRPACRALTCSWADRLIYGYDLISGGQRLIRPGHPAHVLAELAAADNEEIILLVGMQFLSSPLQLLLCRQAFLGDGALHHENTQYNFRFWLRLLFAN